MPITHLRFVHSKVPADWVATTYEDLEEDSFLLFDPVSEATKTGIGDMFRRLDPALTISDNIIIRGISPQLLEAIKGDAILKQEIGAKPVMALIGGTRPAGPGPQLVPITGFNLIPEPPSLENLRQAELHAILERTKGIYTSASYHYALPSTYHADKFIRLGTALEKRHDVRRMVDWVLEYLKGDTIVVADTGSLLPLLYSLREQAESRFGWKVEIATLDEYPSERSSLTDAVEAINNRPVIADILEEERQYLFLISVSSSGHTCELFKSLRLPHQTTLVFCQTPNTNRDFGPEVAADPYAAALVTIPVYRSRVGTDGKCPKCAETPAIHVHPMSYELLPTLQWEPVVIGKELAEKTRWFWEIASEVDAVRLHDYAPYSGRAEANERHFSVYLDTAKLAAHAGFRERCLTKLRSIPAPNVVLIPEHRNTHVVRALCEEAYGRIATGIVSTVRLSEEHESLLRGSERVLVADDAIVSGTTLVNLRGEVFRVTQDLGTGRE